MRLRPRLTLLIGLATLIPLAVAGVMATTVARDAHLAQARELYARQADGLAVFAATWLSAQVRGVQLIASSWDVRALDSARAEGLARLDQPADSRCAVRRRRLSDAGRAGAH